MSKLAHYSDLNEYLHERVRPFFGLTTAQLAESLKIPFDVQNKVLKAQIVRKLISTIVQEPWRSEMSSDEYSIRTLTMNKNDHFRESHPIIGVDFKGILYENWENSSLKSYLDNTRFIFFYFKETEEGNAIFQGIKIWKMSLEDVEHCFEVWAKVKDLLSCNGVRVYEFDNSTNLPKMKDHRILHVRPRAKNANDKVVLDNGVKITKQAFWINSSYLEEIHHSTF